MATKKRSFVIGLMIVVTALLLPVALHINESTPNLYALIEDLMLAAPSVYKLEGWSSGHKQGLSLTVSPNLSTCHPSFGRKDLLVNCCPPRDESLETVVDFKLPDPSSPLRIRKPLHLLDADYIAKYNKAISLMKSLPFTDPRNFYRQANLHCLYCTGAYDQQNHNYPLNIHSTWFFYPWHRMFLYFHEKILGSLIGDETFALPYWPWDIPEGMVLPEMFRNGSLLNTNRDVSHFPPRVADLSFLGLDESGLNPEEQIKANNALMYTQMISGAKKMELYMGCRYKAGEKGYCHGTGTVEFAPHDTMHYWVGNGSNPRREDMGVFYTAARDPIFYPHHNNIDRLWNVWRGLHQDKVFDDPDWLESSFYFRDEKSQLVRIKVRDVLDMEKLRYKFEKVDMPWLNARPKPSVPPKVASHMLKIKEANNLLQMPSNHHFLSSDFRPYSRNLDTKLTVKVVRPQINRSKKVKEEEEEVLVVYGIDVKEDVYTKFDVYINVVDETTISPASREFAGTFVYMAKGVKAIRNVAKVARMKHELKMGISELLEDLEAEGDQTIWVTLLPRTRYCINVTVDGLRIEYMR